MAADSSRRICRDPRTIGRQRGPRDVTKSSLCTRCCSRTGRNRVVNTFSHLEPHFEIRRRATSCLQRWRALSSALPAPWQPSGCRVVTGPGYAITLGLRQQLLVPLTRDLEMNGWVQHDLGSLPCWTVVVSTTNEQRPPCSRPPRTSTSSAPRAVFRSHRRGRERRLNGCSVHPFSLSERHGFAASVVSDLQTNRA